MGGDGRFNLFFLRGVTGPTEEGVSVSGSGPEADFSESDDTGSSSDFETNSGGTSGSSGGAGGALEADSVAGNSAGVCSGSGSGSGSGETADEGAWRSVDTGIFESDGSGVGSEGRRYPPDGFV